MKRVLSLVLAVFVALSLSFGCSNQKINSEINNSIRSDNLDNIQKSISSTVKIVAFFEESPAAEGSGVIVISDDQVYIWTCAHVVTSLIGDQEEENLDEFEKGIEYFRRNPLRGIEEENASGVVDAKVIRVQSRVKNFKERNIRTISYQASIVDYDLSNDIALLKSDVPARIFKSYGIEGVKFDKRDTFNYKELEAVYHIGNMLRTTNTVRNGYIANNRIHVETYDPMDGNRFSRRIFISNFASFGSSGGGVFLHKDNKCIGLLSSISLRLRGSYVIPYKTIEKFAITTDNLQAIQ